MIDRASRSNPYRRASAEGPSSTIMSERAAHFTLRSPSRFTQPASGSNGFELDI
jgi:hypothetical protein